MAKRKAAKPAPRRKAGKRSPAPRTPGLDAREARDVAATRKALAPVLAAGVSHYRLASAAGSHPEDMRGFLEGRITLTPALRQRLVDQIPNFLQGDPR